MKQHTPSTPLLVPVFLMALSVGVYNAIPLGAQPNYQALRAMDLRNNLSIPAGPEAASLGRYGEVGISHYTGALDFSIPLATIGDKALSWSFSLRYDGSGVKPDELPAQVGQNWSLVPRELSRRQQVTPLFFVGSRRRKGIVA